MERGALGESRIGILVVDDFEPWRRFIYSALLKQSQWRVIAEASDGLAAVQKAEDLQPDLILLDIGLPVLNGIEAARRIRKLSPKSQILFVSEHRSIDIAKEAIRAGGCGYVIKSDAGKDLLPAVAAVIQGKPFASSELGDQFLFDAISEAAIAHCGSNTAQVNVVSDNNHNNHRHEVVFYPNDSSLVRGFALFAESALETGVPVIVIATGTHRAEILQKLRADGVEIEAAIEQGRYIALDPVDAISGFMVNDMPDPTPFMRITTDLIAHAAKAAQGECPRVAACGECAPTLLAKGKAEAAILLEHLWDDVAKSHEIDILCGYVSSAFARDEPQILERIRAEHSAGHMA
jgi:DNA-binding NarL/FixJ family response regulator